MVWRGRKTLVRDDFSLSLVDNSFMRHPLYAIPYQVRKQKFFDWYFSSRG